jgi:hypothetical protein
VKKERCLKEKKIKKSGRSCGKWEIPRDTSVETECPAISQKSNLSVEHIKTNSARLDEENRGLKNSLGITFMVLLSLGEEILCQCTTFGVTT